MKNDRHYKNTNGGEMKLETTSKLMGIIFGIIVVCIYDGKITPINAFLICAILTIALLYQLSYLVDSDKEG